MTCRDCVCSELFVTSSIILKNINLEYLLFLYNKANALRTKMNAGYISQRIYRDITQKRLKTKISPFVCYTHMNLGSIYNRLFFWAFFKGANVANTSGTLSFEPDFVKFSRKFCRVLKILVSFEIFLSFGGKWPSFIVVKTSGTLSFGGKSS